MLQSGSQSCCISFSKWLLPGLEGNEVEGTLGRGTFSDPPISSRFLSSSSCSSSSSSASSSSWEREQSALKMRINRNQFCKTKNKAMGWYNLVLILCVCTLVERLAESLIKILQIRWLRTWEWVYSFFLPYYPRMTEYHRLCWSWIRPFKNKADSTTLMPE